MVRLKKCRLLEGRDGSGSWVGFPSLGSVPRDIPRGEGPGSPGNKIIPFKNMFHYFFTVLLSFKYILILQVARRVNLYFFNTNTNPIRINM